jgi:hypothetical protein
MLILLSPIIILNHKQDLNQILKQLGPCDEAFINYGKYELVLIPHSECLLNESILLFTTVEHEVQAYGEKVRSNADTV